MGKELANLSKSTSCKSLNEQGLISSSSPPQSTPYMVEGCEGPYIDYWSFPVQVIKKQMQGPKSKRKGPRGGVSEPFPVKLYEMLVGVEQEGQLEHVVAWQSHGRCFMIYHAQAFVDEIMPRYVVIF